jgi:hypothetical protein
MRCVELASRHGFYVNPTENKRDSSSREGVSQKRRSNTPQEPSRHPESQHRGSRTPLRRSIIGSRQPESRNRHSNTPLQSRCTLPRSIAAARNATHVYEYPPLRFNDRIHSPMIAKTLFEHPLRAIPAGKNSKREFEQRIPQPIIATRGIETTPRRFNDQIVPARISKRGFEQCILQPIMATRGIEQLIPQPVITKSGFESPRGDHLAAQACPSHLVTGVHAHLCAD